MLVVETIAKIRRAFFVEGKSIKQICRDLRLSRNTVGKLFDPAIPSSATIDLFSRARRSIPGKISLIACLRTMLENPSAND